MSLKQLESVRNVKVEEHMRMALERLSTYQESAENFSDEQQPEIDVQESQSIASLAASSCLETLRCGRIKERLLIGDNSHRASVEVQSKIFTLKKHRNIFDDESINTYVVGDHQLFSPKIQESERLILQESIESFKPLKIMPAQIPVLNQQKQQLSQANSPAKARQPLIDHPNS